MKKPMTPPEKIALIGAAIMFVGLTMLVIGAARAQKQQIAADAETRVEPPSRSELNEAFDNTSVAYFTLGISFSNLERALHPNATTDEITSLAIMRAKDTLPAQSWTRKLP